MRIFISSPPIVYKYIWVVAEADFKHIQKIAFGRSLKHCRAGELHWNLELSFWIKCSYLLYLSSQITGSCYWQLGTVIQSILPVSCVWSAQWAMSDQNSGAACLFYKSITQLQQQGCQLAKQQVFFLSRAQRSLCGHPYLMTSCFTQYGSPLRACKNIDALKAIAFPLYFHNAYWWKSHQLWQLCTRMAGGPHTAEVAKEYFPFWANAGKIDSQVLQQHVESHVCVGWLPSAWLFYF